MPCDLFAGHDFKKRMNSLHTKRSLPRCVEKQNQLGLELWDSYTWQVDAAQLPHPHSER